MSENTKNLGNGWEVSVARTFEEVESLRQIWKEMQSREKYPVPNADIDWYLSVLRPRKEQMQPYIMVFHQDGEPVAMVVGRLEKYQLRCRIGYKVVWNPSPCCLTVVYGGVLCDSDEKAYAVVMKHLQLVLKIGTADMIFFNELRTDTLFYRLARNVPSFFCRQYMPRIEIHRSQSIPENIESFYKKLSKKHRANMRRAVRKLEKEYSGEVKIVKYSHKDDVGDLMETVSMISNKTYQHAMGRGFVDDLPARHLVERSVELGMLCGYVLFVGGHPCAFELLTLYRNTYFLDKIGYDPAWKSWNVGTVLFIKVLEDLCNTTEVNCLDFLFGDAEYKQHYADKNWNEASVYVFAPRFYPVLINVVDSLIRGFSFF